MEREARKTSPYGLGRMIHVVHMSEDAAAMTKFYEDVFGAVTYMGQDGLNYLEVEDRWATLVVISDLCIEPMAPTLPANPELPVGKFYSRFGRHLHSIGYQIDDLAGFGNHLIDQDVYIGKPGGGRATEIPEDLVYFYPRPPDVGGVMCEVCRTPMHNDPRDNPYWSSMRKLWESHPLGIERMQYVTFGVRDLAAAKQTLKEKWLAVDVADGVDEEQQAEYTIVQIGDSLVQFAAPLEPGTPLGKHVEKHGNFIYGITMKVNDLDRAEAHLRSKGVRTSRPGPATVAADPEDCFGSPYFFTTRTIPNDPFDKD